MPDDGAIVAVGLLTREEVRNLGGSLKLVFPLPSDGRFDDLIRSLDRVGAGRVTQANRQNEPSSPS
jgi:hypothetical protein